MLCWLLGTQRVISFLRQIVERGGFYRMSDQTWVKVERVQFVGACNPPTDPGRKPLSHRFVILSLCEYSSISYLMNICVYHLTICPLKCMLLFCYLYSMSVYLKFLFITADSFVMCLLSMLIILVACRSLRFMAHLIVPCYGWCQASGSMRNR